MGIVRSEPIIFCEARTVCPIVRCLAFLFYYPFALSAAPYSLYSHPYFTECRIIIRSPVPVYLLILEHANHSTKPMQDYTGDLLHWGG